MERLFNTLDCAMSISFPTFVYQSDTFCCSSHNSNNHNFFSPCQERIEVRRNAILSGATHFIMEEIWKDITGYEGSYQVSNFGRVKSLEREIKGHGSSWVKPESIMKQSRSHKGYPIVRFCLDSEKKSFVVHRLVATAFIDNPENKPQVNHIDCDKKNNSASNLEWCTNSENQLHAFKTGLNYHTENHRIANIKRGLLRRRLTDSQVGEIKAMRASGRTFREISEAFSISGKMAEQIVKEIKYKPVNIQL